MNQLNLHIISSTEDNNPLLDRTGWVDNFVRYLKLVIGRIGYYSNISYEIHTQNFEEIPTSENDISLIIVSPSLLNSGEYEQLINKLAKKNLNGKRFQTFRIMKSAIPTEALNRELSVLFAYNFYSLDLDSGNLEEYENAEDFEEDSAFWMIMVDLCYDILQKSKVGIKALGGGKSIFLAETGDDLQKERQLVRRELKRYGYEVLPKSNLLANPSELHSQMMKDLPKCLFSIHLVGKNPGEFTQDKIAVPAFQHSIASNYAQMAAEKGEDFKEIVWMKPDAIIESEEQRLFVRDLQKSANSQNNIEIIQMRLEDFKSVVMKNLEQQNKRNALAKKHDLLNGKKRKETIQEYI